MTMFVRMRMLLLGSIFVAVMASCLGAVLQEGSAIIELDPVGIAPSDPSWSRIPFVDGAKTFVGGSVTDYAGPIVNVTSPIIDLTTNSPIVIGRISDMQESDIPALMLSAKNAWGSGQGTWPQMTFEQRISALEAAVVAIKLRREEIITTLMWEICKTYQDAVTEFDRTMTFVAATIAAFRELDSREGGWRTIEGIFAKVRRAAIGIMLCVGPFNYPFNETYATLIPALLMGNVVIMKIPSIGGLVHMLTMQAYAEHLPPGVLQFLTGQGRKLLPKVMATGDVDVLAFIGGSKAADQLIHAHPHVHRLKVFLQLEGKNVGVVAADALGSAEKDKELVDQLLLGTLSYNGQRCTALKLLFVHSSVVEQVSDLLSARLQSLPYGLPWQPFTGPLFITPLPGSRIQAMRAFLQDALSKGARIVNPGGGQVRGRLMIPALVDGLTNDMALYREEQFGPLIPLVPYHNVSEILDYLRSTEFGQQASLFGHNEAELAQLVDALSTVVGRVNINTQCGRSPDSLPFSGRRSSAQGTMSITEALRTFSVDVVVAGKQSLAQGNNPQLMSRLDEISHFMQPLHHGGKSHSDL